jgi:hypothetical protein
MSPEKSQKLSIFWKLYWDLGSISNRQLFFNMEMLSIIFHELYCRNIFLIYFFFVAFRNFPDVWFMILFKNFEFKFIILRLDVLYDSKHILWIHWINLRTQKIVYRQLFLNSIVLPKLHLVERLIFCSSIKIILK